MARDRRDIRLKMIDSGAQGEWNSYADYLLELSRKETKNENRMPMPCV